jgi:hypothetical protein
MRHAKNIMLEEKGVKIAEGEVEKRKGRRGQKYRGSRVR